MTDILSLSGLDLRKEVAKAKGYEVDSVPRYGGGEYYFLTHDGVKVGVLSNTEGLAWQQSPPLDLAHTFPLVLEMNRWGWDVEISTHYDDVTEGLLIVIARNDWRGKSIRVESDSQEDPSDAIAKAYLLVRREMNL